MIDIDQLKIDYPNIQKLHTRLGEKLKELIADALHEKPIHVITGRTKGLESLTDKIISKGKYNNLSEVTDIYGLRVITYMDSDVTEVSQIIRDNFIVDEINSSDKREKLPSEFGYNSLHLVISLQEERTRLPEYKDFKGLKAEVQVRSILQHAWAEIEHDLGFKSKEEVPKELNRGFNRLAALLELADGEFDRLKASKQAYQNKIEKSASNKPEEKLPVDLISLSYLVDNNETFNAIRKMLIETYGSKFAKTADYQNILEKLEYLNIKYIDELEDGINQNKAALINFTRLLFETRDRNKAKYLQWQSPLAYFLHFIAASKGRDYLEGYKKYRAPSPEGNVIEVTDFIALYRNATLA